MNAPLDPIVHLEHAAFARQHDRALATLEALLSHLDVKATEPGDGLFDEDARVTVQATRVAAAISAMLTDPALQMTPEWYMRLIPFKRQLQAIFDVSGYEGSAMPLRYMSDGVAHVSTPQQEQSQLLKMLIIMGLSDCSEQMLDVVKRIDPTATAPLILGLVASKIAFSPDAWRARETLFGMGERLLDAQLSPNHLPLLTSAWMQCSYAFRPDRHEFKSALNRWLRQGYEGAGLKVPPLKRAKKKKRRPRVVILAEVFWDGHAMYRCYADRVRQLKERFDTVLVARKGDIDDAARALVHRTVPFPDDMARVDQMAQHVLRLEPDVIYYPSIGMAPWAVALANLRLAPIQMMSPGHPATSATDTVDYLLLARPMVGDVGAYAERVVICGEGRPRQSSHRMVEVPRYRREADGEPVNIAVPAYTMKLSWPLFERLQQIEARAKRRIRWHFFPNESGLSRQHARAAIERLLAEVIVYPRVPYAQYLEWLGQCQLSVGTFPFAGSNSNVDVLRVGIPRVVVAGREAMERADVNVLGRFDDLESLVTDGPDAFVDRTVELVDDPDERDRLSARILEQRPNERFLDTPESGTPFLEAVSYAYEHHGRRDPDANAALDPFVSKEAR